MNRKSQATVVLIIMTIGTLLTMNKTGFWINLLHNGCMAAMIGGLADWFAITAIFKKPLGISWRTAILPRNRERIMDEIINFIGRDLLNTDNIMKDIVRYDMSKMCIEYFEKLGGRKRLKETVHPIVREFLKSSDSDNLASMLCSMLREHKDNNLVKDILVQIIKKSADAEKFNILIDLLNTFADKMLHDQKIRAILQPILHDIREEYKEGSALREMMVAMFDLDDDSLTNIIVEKLLKDCAELKDTENVQRQGLQHWISDTLPQQIIAGRYDTAILNAENKITAKIDIQKAIKNCIDEYKNNDIHISELTEKLDSLIDAGIDAFIANKASQEIFDSWLKKRLSIFAKESSPILLQMVKDKLNSYSTDDFIELVESHINNDLQMIRINGSLVGGTAGMFLYALIYFAERIYS